VPAIVRTDAPPEAAPTVRLHAVSEAVEAAAGLVRTLDQVTEASRRVLELFPEGLEIKIKGMTAEDDRVAIEAESHGRHKSGRTYHNVYHFLMRARDGKIVEWREYLDTMHAADVLCEGM